LPCILFEKNEFVANMRREWKTNCKALIIAANPDNYPLNDEMRETFYKAFMYHDLIMEELVLCDKRNAADVEELVKKSEMIILGGGHVPTAHKFWVEEMGLREHLKDFDGIIMGISAGTMLCADIVYAQPEEGGESIDPKYERFIDGLGLTYINALPHYQEVRDKILDGKRLYEDITCEDSYGKQFYTMIDGSYIMQRKTEITLYGEAYLVSDGKVEKICENGASMRIG
ncbi:MAG: Type 1 glutamine amidotransferase-like domain-containing protein, partial [Dorea sp.]